MTKGLSAILKKVGIDGAIAFTILTRIVQAGGGVVSVFFIAKFLSGEEQGYYYTFASILAIQIFFELGLSGIITQYAAHEFAHLQWSDDLTLLGDEQHQSRLSSLLRFCVKWFGIISLILFFSLLAAGFYFFSKYNHTVDIKWQTPWVILCLATSLNLFIDPILAFFDGLGRVKDMSKVRLVQKTTNVFLLFILFALGFKLYTSAIASLAAILINYVQILQPSRLKLLKEVWRANKQWRIDYVREIFPYQWRIALSWISGYFIFQLFNPVLFATEGAIVAGQMGMTLQALNGISSISMSWITTKIPAFSNYISKGEYSNLDKLFNATLKNVCIINWGLLFIFMVIVQALHLYAINYANRFLPFVPNLLLCITTFANMIIFSWATYLRCHKKEPFLVQSVVCAILISISTLTIGKMYGIMGLVSGYSFVIVVVSTIWSYYLFVTNKNKWHNLTVK